MENIGWIGLGRMGNPMSQRLLNEGYSLTIFNRSKSKTEAHVAQGAKCVSSPSEVIRQTDIVIMMVSDDQATREIFISKEGLLSAGVSNKLIINMSTVSPEISKEMSAICLKQNNFYIDAPVSGSVKQAESGQLVVMVGCEEELFTKVKPVLDKLGKLTINVGKTGAGNTAKLAVNNLLGIVTQGFSESVKFAKENGIETKDFLEIINNSALGSPYLKIKGEAILNNNYQAAFALKHIVKDLRLAKESGLDTPLCDTAYKSFKAAEAKLGEEDIISVLKSL